MIYIKKIFTLIFIVITSNILCQSIDKDLIFWQGKNQSNPFITNSSDSLIKNEIDNSVYGINGNLYLYETKYFLKNGNEVLINIFNDTNVLYREFHDGNQLHKGEMHKDYEKPFIFDVHDSLTGEDIGIDTTYFLSPNGMWILNENNTNYEVGLFQMGIRIGEWQVLDKKKFHLPVITKKFNNGIIVDTTQIDLSNDNNIQELVAKNWIRRGVIFDLEDDFIHVIYVTSDSVHLNLGLSLEFSYSELHLTNDLTFSGKRNQRCGSSPINDNYLNPSGTWKLIKGKKNQNLLKIEDELYQIEYISETTLIIKIKKDV